jgi:hypothetical protein
MRLLACLQTPQPTIRQVREAKKKRAHGSTEIAFNIRVHDDVYFVLYHFIVNHDEVTRP